MSERRAIVMIGTITLTVLGIGATPASAGGGCFHSTPTDGSGTAVEIAEVRFGPTILQARPSDEITWVNHDVERHNVIGVGGTWGGFDELTPGDEVSYRFEDNGVYVYSCLIHPGMVGAVVIGDASGSAGLDPAAVVPCLPPTEVRARPERARTRRCARARGASAWASSEAPSGWSSDRCLRER